MYHVLFKYVSVKTLLLGNFILNFGSSVDVYTQEY